MAYPASLKALIRTATEETPASSPNRSVLALMALMEEIARLRAEVVRKETVAHEVEKRLRSELGLLENQLIAARTETFRILGRHLRDGWLPRKSGKLLRQAVVSLADELEAEYGADLATERRVYLGVEDEEEAEERAIYGGRRPAGARRADSRMNRDGYDDDATPGSRASGNGTPEGGSSEEASGGADFFAGPEGAAWSGEGPRPGSGRGESGKKRTGSRAASKRAARDQALSGDIRALYLILARALHPDKEANPALREAKTVWMQKVTAAYAKRDLAMLLDILARDPLEAVGPYLAEAPPKTLQGFAKRLRRELAALKVLAAKAGEWLHPFFARFLKDGAADEARIARHIADLNRLVKLSRQRAAVYRTRAGVEELVEGLRRHPWQDLL